MISCEYCEIFKNVYFGENLGTDAFLCFPVSYRNFLCYFRKQKHIKFHCKHVANFKTPFPTLPRGCHKCMVPNETPTEIVALNII